MYKYIFNEAEIKALKQLIDAGVKLMGVIVASNAVALMSKLDNPLKEEKEKK